MAAAAQPESKLGTPEKRDRWTVLDVLRWTTSRFEERNLPSPRLDAEVLIAAALGLPRVQLYVQFERPLDASELGAIRENVRRRQGGDSVAYIVGRKEFFGLDFAVDSRVLVPRPDTETLVDEALARLRERAAAAGPPPPSSLGEAPKENGENGALTAEAAPANEAAGPVPVVADVASGAHVPVVADVGTGSGAIIVALGKQLPAARLFAVDQSAPALEVARANAERHQVTVEFLHGNLEAPLRPHAPFDLIAANLPYIPSADIPGLAPEVRAEPVTALDGGPDGLELVRQLIAAAPALLSPGGALVLEIGVGQAAATAELCAAAGFVDIRRRRDLGAVDRVVSAVRP